MRKKVADNIIKKAKERIKKKYGKLEGNFNINADWVLRQAKIQKNKCYYSGLKMTWGKIDARRVTIDKIDPNKGYLKSNCVLACYKTNIFKHIDDTDTMIEFCIGIIDTYIKRL